MNKLQGYIFGTLLLFGLSFALSSCDKEVDANEEEKCNCIEQHEIIDTWVANGVIVVGYVLEYETPAEERSCSLDNGEYIQKSNSTRYRIKCY